MTSFFRAECFVKNKGNVTVPLACKGTGSRKSMHCAQEIKGNLSERSHEKPRTDHSLTEMRILSVHPNTVVWVFIYKIKFVNFY